MSLGLRRTLAKLFVFLVRPSANDLFQLMKPKIKSLIRAQAKTLIKKQIRYDLFKNRRFQERLKIYLESLDNEKTLFDGAPSYEKRFGVFPSAIEQAKKCGGGLWLEFGVWRGASLNFIAKHTDDTIYGFDSFEGLPDPWEKSLYDISPKGKRDLGRVLPTVKENVHLVVGLFQDVLSDFLKEHPDPACFVHIDSDLYESARYVLERLTFKNGAVIIFDEYYNYPLWREGEYKAFSGISRQKSARCRKMHWTLLAFRPGSVCTQFQGTALDPSRFPAGIC